MDHSLRVDIDTFTYYIHRPQFAAIRFFRRTRGAGNAYLNGNPFPGKTYEVALYARNITDTANLQGAIDFNNLAGFVGDPRVIGIEFKAKIGG